MLTVKFSVQPTGGELYRSLVVEALRHKGIKRLDAAVAYATTGGVACLDEGIGGELRQRWEAIDKRWLIGIDWCRTEPKALEILAQMPRAEVRVHDGLRVSRRPGCVPERPFHPKVYIVAGRGLRGVISGSGNLSKNGLSKGHEVGQLCLVAAAAGVSERHIGGELKRVGGWFENMWRVASPVGSIRETYEEAFALHLKTPMPTDDDAASEQVLGRKLGNKSLESADLSRLRSATVLWIEAGRLHKNRGLGKAGNQLMMSPMTRVFFGFPAEDVARDTKIGDVMIGYDGGEVGPYSLRFSNNSMDVLSLPIPGAAGPVEYDLRVLVFRRHVVSGVVVFDLHLASSQLSSQLAIQSKSVDGLFTMTSGRRWGVL